MTETGPPAGIPGTSGPAGASDTEVLVIGAGIIGASCAYELAARGKRVTVVDALEGAALGSSGRSFASVRAQWADPLNIALSWNSIRRWRGFAAEHGTDAGYRPTGYLLLFPEEAWTEQLAVAELQRSFGIPTEVLTPAQAQAHTAFATSGIGGATWSPGDGQVDPHRATGTLLAHAKSLGAVVSYRFAVEHIERTLSGWEVRATDGRSVRAELVVNAAGGWAAEVAVLAGFDVPVVHSRRNVFTSAAGSAPGPVPMTVDVETGAFLRGEGDRILFGLARPDEPDGYNVDLDRDWLLSVMEAAAARFPWLADLPIDLRASWAGTYENTPDHTVILSAEPTEPTFVHACGASGHGVMQAPELGRMAAELVCEGRITSYDARPLSISRFRRAGAAASAHTTGLVF